MSKYPFLSLALTMACLGSIGQAQLGSVLRSQKINDAQRGFTGVLHDDDYFGWSLAALGDLNGDGVTDLAVGAPEDDDGGPNRGAVWILFLKRSGSVLAHQKISQTEGGLSSALSDEGMFGRRLEQLGDIDGDGIGELASVSGGPNRIWILFLNRDGTLRRHVEIHTTDPVFVPATVSSDIAYGHLAALGDVDGDRVPDLAVGAPLDDDGPGSNLGAVWILQLRADGTAKSAQKVSQTEGGLAENLRPEGEFGLVLSPAGDLDGDGRAELLAGTGLRTWMLYLDANGSVRVSREVRTALYYPRVIGDLDGDGGLEVASGEVSFHAGTPREKGATRISFLGADLRGRKGILISHERGGLGPLPDDTYFGMAHAALGDLDGDGGIELAVGAPHDHDAGEDRGAVWILSLDPSAVRNGSGANPVTLSQIADPVLGANWDVILDCSGHAAGLAFVTGWTRPLSGVFLPQGELLVDVRGGRRLFRLGAPHAAGPTQLSTLVPLDQAFVGLTFHAQGLCTGAPGARFSNALDVQTCLQ